MTKAEIVWKLSCSNFLEKERDSVAKTLLCSLKDSSREDGYLKSLKQVVVDINSSDMCFML